MSTLCINLHPFPEKSIKCNQTLEQLKGIKNIEFHAIAPIMNFDNFSPDKLKSEQDLLLKFTNIIFLYPMYWYEMPSQSRFWLEQILTPGFGYNLDQSDAILSGREIYIIQTTGAPKADYIEKFPKKEIIAVQEMTFRFCGCKIVKDWIIGDDEDVSQACADIIKYFE